jgi:cation diffusion facilitator family transporter
MIVRVRGFGAIRRRGSLSVTGRSVAQCGTRRTARLAARDDAGARAGTGMTARQTRSLKRYAWISVGAAVVTITLKLVAYRVTDSVGLLSDALESVVNLVAAVAAVIALGYAGKDPDEDHAFGHDKAEYFSSGFEGALVLAAAAGIAFTAIPRFFNPAPVEQVGLGTVVAVAASVLNFAVARLLFKAGREHRSVTLVADAHHLMTDVWTTVGVLAGVAIVFFTGWERLDPVIAVLVAVNIVRTGFALVRRSMLGLLDTALPPEDREKVHAILTTYEREHGIETHALRTRTAGARNFIAVHVLVPGEWSVDKGHDLLEWIENDIREAIPGTTMFTHLEPLHVPASYHDTGLDRTEAPRYA